MPDQPDVDQHDGTTDDDATSAAQQGAGSQGGSSAGDDSDNADRDWKAEARKWEARARQNNAKATRHEQALRTLAQQLGLTPEDDDPKKLTASLTAAQQEALEARRELAITRRAKVNGADPDRLSDSASFLRSIRDIDPTDEAALDAAIKAAVEKNPALAGGSHGAGFQDTRRGSDGGEQDADAEALRVLGF